MDVAINQGTGRRSALGTARRTRRWWMATTGADGLLAACGAHTAPQPAGPAGSAATRQPATLRYITEPGSVDSGVKDVLAL